MTLADIALIAVGAFYVFAGYFATRAILTSRLIDETIAKITLSRTPRYDRIKTRSGLTIATCVLASGATLMAHLSIAAWLFAAALALQVLYLFLVAPRLIDPTDPPNPRGRRQSTNAMVIYAAATALVVWAQAQGLLTTLDAASWPALVVAGGALIAHLAYLIRGLLLPPSKSPSDTTDPDDDEDPGNAP